MEPTTQPSAEMLRRFTYHAPTPEQVAAMVEIRARALELASAIERLCPPGRETANAVTQVEQASMWANAAIARPAAAAPRGLTLAGLEPREDGKPVEAAASTTPREDAVVALWSGEINGKRWVQHGMAEAKGVPDPPPSGSP